MQTAIQHYHDTPILEAVLCNIPSARVGATRLAHLGCTIEQVTIDRDGARCQVVMHETGVCKAPPDLQSLTHACTWLLEQGYLVLRAEWLGPVKNPRVWIAKPESHAELDPVLIATGRAGMRLVHTWCAVRFGCEIRWEDVE